MAKWHSQMLSSSLTDMRSAALIAVKQRLDYNWWTIRLSGIERAGMRGGNCPRHQLPVPQSADFDRILDTLNNVR